MKISYVIPTYNGAAVLNNTIVSLLNQIHSDFEIIVVDDFSSDSTNYLKDCYKNETKIKWFVMNERKGAAACRNIGNSYATGEVIAVCDSGDFYLPNRGLKLEQFFLDNSNIDICYSDVQINTPLDRILGVQKAIEWDGNSKPPISHPTVAYRSKVIHEVHYCEDSFETDFYEFFLIKCFRKEFKFGIIPEITCIKYDLSQSRNYRNVPKAKALKFQKYKEYGIKIQKDQV